MRSTFRTSATVAGLLALTASAGMAQSANIQATATVLSAINVTGAVPLAFGNVTPNVAKTVGVVGGGRFDLTGQASANVNIAFTLPTQLTSGGNNLAIGTYTAYHNTTNSASSGGTAFTPSASVTPTAFGAGGTLFVFVGATVSPTAVQAAGTYTGTVQLTAAYF